MNDYTAYTAQYADDNNTPMTEHSLEETGNKVVTVFGGTPQAARPPAEATGPSSQWNRRQVSPAVLPLHRWQARWT